MHRFCCVGYLHLSWKACTSVSKIGSTVNADTGFKFFQLNFTGIKCLCSLAYCSYGFVTFRTAEEARKVQEMVWSHLKTVFTKPFLNIVSGIFNLSSSFKP